MMCFTHPQPGQIQPAAAPQPVHLNHAPPPPGREQLRHLIIGSPDGVQSAIHSLHILNYADQATWSRLLTIPASGILITPQQGEMFSYLVRHRQ